MKQFHLPFNYILIDWQALIISSCGDVFKKNILIAITRLRLLRPLAGCLKEL